MDIRANTRAIQELLNATKSVVGDNLVRGTYSHWDLCLDGRDQQWYIEHDDRKAQRMGPFADLIEAAKLAVTIQGITGE